MSFRFSVCLQDFLVPVRRLWPQTSLRALAKCRGNLQTTTAVALFFTTSCRSGTEAFLAEGFCVSAKSEQRSNQVSLLFSSQRREAGRRTYVNMMSGENKVSWTVKDLIPNGEYYFRVRAVNKIGGGEYVELRNPVIAEDQKRKTVHKNQFEIQNRLILVHCDQLRTT